MSTGDTQIVTQQVASAEAEVASRSWSERVIEGVIRLCGISAVLILTVIFLFLIKEGIGAFREIRFLGLVSSRWYPIEGMYGLMPLIVGSLLVTAVAIVFAVPLGLITAIFLGEIAPPWLREILKPLVEVLAGIPSIVLGFFGWLVVAPLLQSMGAPSGLTAFTGALILAYMTLPTIISITEDALYAVPKEYRDGSLAIGATQWQTIWRVVLPAARSGIVIAVMLGLGRAIGETMLVLMVTGNAANIPEFGFGMLFQPVRTMTATIASEMGEVAQGSLHYSMLFAIGIVLFIITFIINSLATRFVGGGRRRRGGQI
ncbi:MAG: phosphate ABC transporter permease subunit PstC [Chloroflexi bacterium]|jgi:phosphate transport system permease protein|nr:phosphate ABC transporter permease subunit PstC [Chloroflexota bacterium]